MAVLWHPPALPLLPQALYDYVPSTSDLQPLLTWLSTMERAHVNLGRWVQGHGETGERQLFGVSPARFLLSRLQKDLCWAHLPRLFSAAMNCFLSPHSQVVVAAARTLEVPHTGSSLAALGLVGALLSSLGLSGECRAPLCLPGWGICGPLLPHFPCLPLQTLLSECVAPHIEDLGTVSVSAPAPAAYLCKMFR